MALNSLFVLMCH